MTRREVGQSITIEDLSLDPHQLLHDLRNEGPVSWVPALDAWLVTGHDLCVEVMLDAKTFTVDDPRFSTQQIIGPSMLSLDGAEHKRHRSPFAGPFRAAHVAELDDLARAEADVLVDGMAANGTGDLRSELAAPLAVRMMVHILDLHDVEVGEVLEWYEQIVDAVHRVTAGGQVPNRGLRAFAALKDAVGRNRASSALLETVGATGTLSLDEIASNVAVLLFGGIVTAESATAITFRYLLDERGLIDEVDRDRSLVSAVVEEALRIEPAAAAVDRYATRDVRVGDADVGRGDLVRVSLSAGNRDPAVFESPDTFDPHRDNLGRSLTFARGPHACLGLHLARLETIAAVDAVLDRLTGLRPGEKGLDVVTGLVFRVPRTVVATWSEIEAAVN